MKQIVSHRIASLFSYLLFLCLTFSARAQCLSGGITFSTQAQIDNFTTNFPGCHKILGDVTISGSNITNLNGLSTLTSVGGYLNISGNSILTSVSGLSALTSVTSYFQIDNNSTLTTISGFSALTSIGGVFYIRDNTALTSINGFSSLASIQSTFYIYNNGALTSLTGFSALTSTTDLYIYNNASLTSISGFNTVVSLISNLYIVNNATLTNISGFNAVTNIYYFYIQNNATLTSVNGFSALTNSILFKIQNNPALTTLTGFSALNNVNGIFSISQSAITNLPSFSALTSISGYLDIENNPNLTSLNGLSALKTVSSYASIYNNVALTSLNGLSALQSINGDFFISNNTHITSVSGLTALTTVNGNLQINNNNVLTSLNGLNNITPSSITNLIIQDNAQLFSCAIKSTCGYLQTTPTKPNTISGNLSGCNSKSEILTVCTAVGLPIDLISFTGTHINSYNALSWHTATETNNNRFDIERSNGASAFEKLGEVQGAGNSQSVLAYSFRDEIPMQGGNYYRLKQIDTDGKFMYSNIIEVENPNAASFGVSPNPSSDKMYVLGVSDNTAYSITNLQGQVLQSGLLLHNEAINVSALQQGMYFLHSPTQTAKFIKQDSN